MLNLNAIRKGVMQSVPYRWIFFDNLIPKPQLLELLNSFPQEIFGEKSQRIILDQGASLDQVADNFFFDAIKNQYYVNPIPNLSSVWQTLVDELVADAYRACIAKLTGLNLDRHVIRISLSRLDSTANNGLVPHMDSWFVNRMNSGMTLTHLFYFSKDWDTEWGGSLQLLKNEQRESVFQEIPPSLGNSVLFLCSDNAWHVVAPISPLASQPRLQLMVRFYERQIYLKYLKGNEQMNKQQKSNLGFLQ